MEVTQVKTKKLELEKELYRLITEFESETGVCVTNVDIPSIRKYVEIGGIISYYREHKLTASVEVKS